MLVVILLVFTPHYIVSLTCWRIMVKIHCMKYFIAEKGGEHGHGYLMLIVYIFILHYIVSLRCWRIVVKIRYIKYFIAEKGESTWLPHVDNLHLLYYYQ